MQNTPTAHLLYLVRCEMAVSALLRWAGWQQRATPAQIAQEARWRRVRRALALDIMQEKQRLGYAGNLPLTHMLREGTPEYEYFKAQLRAWERARANDPLNGGVK